jgi:hypothetical protein
MPGLPSHFTQTDLFCVVSTITLNAPSVVQIGGTARVLFNLPRHSP